LALNKLHVLTLSLVALERSNLSRCRSRLDICFLVPHRLRIASFIILNRFVWSRCRQCRSPHHCARKATLPYTIFAPSARYCFARSLISLSQSGHWRGGHWRSTNTISIGGDGFIALLRSSRSPPDLAICAESSCKSSSITCIMKSQNMIRTPKRFISDIQLWRPDSFGYVLTISPIKLWCCPHIPVCQSLRSLAPEDNMRPDEKSNDYPACLWSTDISTNTLQYDANLLKRWLLSCIHDHPECLMVQQKVSTANKRPTRILHVGPTHVKLYHNSTLDSFYPYTTLSHIWGTDSSYQLTLKESNLSELQHGVPIDSLPKVFREAAVLTKLLGMQYLWIDSMCIKQDSPLDWEHEANKMAMVYGNATCNLAHPFPPDCTDPIPGLDPRSFLPCILRPATSSSLGIYAAPRSVRKHDWHEIGRWPLSSRAWILQEQSLSPRIVFFGHYNLMWECPIAILDEHMSTLLDRNSTMYNPFAGERFRKASVLNAMTDGFWFFHVWDTIVNDFKSRNLTNSMDNIIAFAGIARAVHNITNMTYLAGIWAESLADSLLWRRPKYYGHDIGQEPIQNPFVHILPTWSWFVAPTGSGRENTLEFSTRFWSRENTLYKATLSSFQWPGCPKDSLPKNSYYDFKNLRITFNTLSFRAELINNSTEVVDGDIRRMLEAQESVGRVVFEVFPDSLGQAAVSLPTTVILCLLAESQNTPVSIGAFERDLAGLVLVHDSAPATFKRIGAWRMSVMSSIHGEETFRKKTPLFQCLSGTRTQDITLV
jgi:hypothetical protein